MEWALGRFYLEQSAERPRAYHWLKRAADSGWADAQIDLRAHFSKQATTSLAEALQSGTMTRAAQAQAFVATNFPDAHLTMISIDTMSPAEYVMVSRVANVQINVVDVDGTLQASSAVAGKIDVPLPKHPIDLPQALLAARHQGMQGDLRSAMLRVARPVGKQAIAFWTLTPRSDPPARMTSYFVAADDGRALALPDVGETRPQ